MEFRILGPVEVVQGSTVLDLGAPKQRAVLAALLIDANRVVSLDRLIDELWGEEAPPAATSSLQAYISNLRRVLEPHRPPRRPPQVLMTRPPGYLLRVAADDLDAARFEAGVAEGRRLLDEGQPAAALRRLDEALRLWRGPALAEFAYERFARVEANRLEELRIVAVEDRLQAAVDLGQHAAAAAELERLAAAHPLRERLWALLMVALYRSRRQADALRAYQAARSVLDEELGIEPGPALRRLEADILAQAPSLEWCPPPEHAPGAIATATSAIGPPSPPAGARRMVGRQRELARLDAALTDAARGLGSAVLIAGEPGIGKTRLSEELVARAAARGFGTAWGGGYEGGGAPAFWPWVGVIRSLLDGGDHQAIREALGSTAAEIAQVVPELEEFSGPLESAPVVDPETARFRLFEAVANFLRRLAFRRPLVVVLDDLQWADVASLNLLGFLGPQLRASSLLVVGTYRPDEVGLHHRLSDTLAALARHQVVQRVELDGLNEAEVADLVATVTGTPVSAQLVAAVQARTDGNPFFVVELARLLQSEGAVGPGAARHLVPAGVRDVVRRRLARLPEQTSSLLNLAAVAGREFELAVLARAAGLEVERALELVEATVVSGLVIEDPEMLEHYRFSHDLVRETVLGELTSVRRAQMHARVGESLEAVAGDDESRVIELANHFFWAAGVGDVDKAIAYAIRAADAAAVRIAYEQAEEQLRRALELLDRLGPGRTRERQELDVVLRLSALVMMTEGFAAPEAGALLARARDLCSQVGESTEMVPVLWRLVTFHTVSANLGTARQLADQLLQVANRSGRPIDLLAAHHAVGVTAVQQGDFQVARSHLEQALAMPEALDDDWLRSWMPQHPAVACSTFLAWAECLTGNQARARELTRKGVELASRLDHDFTTVHALLFDSWIARWTGDLALARRRAAEVLELARARRFSLYAAMGAVYHGWARAGQGEAEAGSAEIREGLAAMQATGARMLHGAYLALLAEAEWEAGRHREALAAVEQGLDVVETTGERFYEAELHRLRGDLLASSGDGASTAVWELKKAVEVARAQGAKCLELRASESLQRVNTRTEV